MNKLGSPLRLILSAGIKASLGDGRNLPRIIGNERQRTSRDGGFD